jgi:predicted amidohydrolase
MIIVPTLWIRNGASDKGRAWNPSAPGLFVDSILTARAVENCCAVVFANAGGKIGGNVSLSHMALTQKGQNWGVG